MPEMKGKLERKVNEMLSSTIEKQYIQFEFLYYSLQ